MKIRRINIMGGAGSGKSITATNIRAQLGFMGYNIELVEEVVKDWTYIPRKPRGSDSFYLQSCQIQKEDIRLRSGVDLIVSDSPVILQYFYAYYHNDPLRKSMSMAFREFEEMYPSLHIFIKREDKFFSQIGRYEDLTEAKKIDDSIQAFMVNNMIEFRIFSCTEQNNIIEYIISNVKE